MTNFGVVRSMTGFASAEGSLPGGARFALTLKGVNHRFLDLGFRLPHGYEALEVDLRRRLKEEIGRGHVDVALELSAAPGAAATGIRVDAAVLRAVADGMRAAALEAGISAELSAESLVRVPGVLVSEGRTARIPLEEVQEPVSEATGQLLAAFQAARAAEGADLARELRAEMARIVTLLDQIQPLRAGVRNAQFHRLRDRLSELLHGAPVSEERLLTEAALLAERSDVEEECVRLRTHIDRFVALLDEGGAVGKRLDFLLQEFNREANTLLSKSGSAAGDDSVELVRLGLEIKAEIERAREQVQNLE